MSNINPNNNYDQNFPVPGQSQSSEQFRKNFRSIRENLSIAKEEIETLENKSIVFTNDVIGTINFNQNTCSLNIKDNPTFNGNHGIILPKGSSAERLNQDATLRFNTTTNKIEFFENLTWKDLDGENRFVTLNGNSTINGNLTTTEINSNISNANITNTNVIKNNRNNISLCNRTSVPNNTYISLGFWDISSITNAIVAVNIQLHASTPSSSSQWSYLCNFIGQWIFNNTLTLGNIQPTYNPDILKLNISDTVSIDMRFVSLGNQIELQVRAISSNPDNVDFEAIINVQNGYNQINFNAYNL